MSALKITIAFITAREAPQLDWLVAALEQQAHKRDELELIVVDAFGRPASAIGYRPTAAVKKLIETRPKPNVWQGPHRITAHDFFANANARNTAIILCSNDYICFVDDRCKPDARWLAQIRRGEKKRESVICGPYDKQEDWGIIVDHRRHEAPKGRKGCSGGWCYGGNHALPLAWALEVNGFEEGCDPVGLEDCVFGHMLENTGRRIDFVAGMSVQQDRRGMFVHPLAFPRHDKGDAPNDKSHALRARFFGRKRTEFTPDLTQLREQVAAGQPLPFPDPTVCDWFDGAPLRGASIPVQERLARARGSGESIISGNKRP